jgi:hypothetical protein
MFSLPPPAHLLQQCKESGSFGLGLPPTKLRYPAKVATLQEAPAGHEVDGVGAVVICTTAMLERWMTWGPFV